MAPGEKAVDARPGTTHGLLRRHVLREHLSLCEHQLRCFLLQVRRIPMIPENRPDQNAQPLGRADGVEGRSRRGADRFAGGSPAAVAGLTPITTSSVLLLLLILTVIVSVPGVDAAPLYDPVDGPS